VTWWRRRSRRSRADFDAEIRAHLLLEADQLRAEGVPNNDALAEARRRFGSVSGARARFARYAAAPDVGWLATLPRDLRHATRSLRRSPALAAVAVLALTVGIGLTTTVFSIVYAAMMRGLPYPGADRIAYVQRTNPSRDIRQMPVPIHDFVDYRARQRSFESLAGYYVGTANVSGAERAERYTGAWVTANTFAVYGVAPALGRAIREGEDRPGGERVAVIGYRLWQDRFGGSPGVIGTPLRINGLPFTVVGVMPDGFALPSEAKVWLPLQLDPLAVDRGEGQPLTVLGRLQPGVSLVAASAELRAIAARLAAEHKTSNEGVSARVVTFTEGELGLETQQLLFTMLGAVFLVLLIACTNVANLLLDRAAHRTKEVGTRPRSARRAARSCGASSPRRCSSPAWPRCSASPSRPAGWSCSTARSPTPPRRRGSTSGCTRPCSSSRSPSASSPRSPRARSPRSSRRAPT
jgi:putative ABC transport system permease protein